MQLQYLLLHQKTSTSSYPASFNVLTYRAMNESPNIFENSSWLRTDDTTRAAPLSKEIIIPAFVLNNNQTYSSEVIQKHFKESFAALFLSFTAFKVTNNYNYAKEMSRAQ